MRLGLQLISFLSVGLVLLPPPTALGSTQDIFAVWKNVELNGADGLGVLLEDCRAGDAGGKGKDSAKCNEAEYMSTVYHDLQQRLQAAEKKEAKAGGGGGGKEIAEMSPSPSLGYEEYFKTYPMEKRPVKFPSNETSSSLPLPMTSVEDFDACFAAAKKKGHTISLSEDCPTTLNDLMVPWYMSNDYIIRVRAAKDSSSKTTKAPSTEFMSQYPQLTRVDRAGQTSDLYTTPSSLHMVMMLQSGELEVRVFSPDQANYLSPKSGTDLFPHEYRYTANVWGEAVAIEEEEVIEEEEEEDEEEGREDEEEDDEDEEEDDDETAAQEKKEKKQQKKEEEKKKKASKKASPPVKKAAAPVAALSSSSGSLLATYSSVTLRPGDAVFIPYGHVVSWRTTKSRTSFVTHALLDASNFKQTKASLVLEAHVSAASQHILDLLNSPKFETGMDRYPAKSPLPWSQFITWPRSSSSLAEGGADDDDGVEGGKSGGGRRNRKKSFKDWQTGSKWTYFIMGLTMPAPSAPVIRHVGRRNVTLEWTTPFVHEQNDIGVSAFQVEVEYTNGGGQWFPGGSHTIRESDMQPKEPAMDDPRTSQGMSIWLYHHVIPDLQPNTSYKARVQQIAGEALSPWSAPSNIFKTGSNALPSAPLRVMVVDDASIMSSSLKLKIEPPVDDGGQKIERYIVWKQHLDDGFHKDWVLAGNFSVTGNNDLSFTITKLFAEASYTFKAAAANGFGMGPASPQSSKIRMAARTKGEKVLHVGGHGHGEEGGAVGEMEGSALGEHVEKDAVKRGPLMMIDDTTETVTVKDAGLENIEVWAAHWSPKHYKVTAEAVWCYPKDGSEEILHNHQIVRNRIVIVERGGVPLVEKAAAAQHAGALGVVILDNGQCTEGGGFNQMCCPGANKAHGEGLGASDFAVPWRKIKIPVVLMLEEHGSAVRKLLEQYHDKNKPLPPWSSMRDEL